MRKMNSRDWITVMMTIRPATYALYFVFLLPLVFVRGQDRDFQSWYELEVAKDLTGRLALSGELELRLENNSRKYDRSLLTLGTSYEFNKHIETAAGVRALLVSDRETGLDTRYRLHADLMGTQALSGLDVSLRVRFQYGFRDPRFFSQWMTNSFANRIKLKGDYHIFGTRLDLHAFVESWGLFLEPEASFFQRIRYSAGISYNLNFRSELSLRYILEDEFNQRDPLQAHILVIAFGYDF